MFELGTPWWEIIIRSAAVYFFVLVVLRITGWRSIGQRNALDLVLILVVANAVQNAMIGRDTSLLGGVIAASTLFVIDTVLDRYVLHHRIPGIGLSGSPRVLISHGQPIAKELSHAGIDHNELMEILREHGYDNLARIKTAVLEMDGTVSVVAEESPAVVTHTSIDPRRKSAVASRIHNAADS